tara:strand:+ start:179 stop:400 length:222 start_codon:yes stop_codon:yes gene_type:complete
LRTCVIRGQIKSKSYTTKPFLSNIYPLYPVIPSKSLLHSERLIRDSLGQSVGIDKWQNLKLWRSSTKKGNMLV